jgi:hypothetical protein
VGPDVVGLDTLQQDIDSPALTLESSPGRETAGDRVYVALVFRGRSVDAGLIAFDGELSWDAEALDLEGQVPEQTRVAVLGSVDEGSVRFAGFGPARYGRLVTLAFRRRRPGNGELTIVASGRIAGPGRPGESRFDLRPVPVLDVAELSAREPTSLAWHEWTPFLDPRLPTEVAAGPARVPGGSPRFGDANANGIITGLDVLYVANVAVSNTSLTQCILNTDAPNLDCIAVNVFPPNLPGLGEATDGCAPGIQTCGGYVRLITAGDVGMIANEAVANDQPVAGELIPYPGIPADTATIPATVTGTLVLGASSAHRIDGALRVGVDGGAEGTLVIEPGARILASPGSVLLVTRNGRLVADGTSFQRITFRCSGITFPGCWQGIRVYGNATINSGAPGNPASPRTAAGCAQAQDSSTLELYGGCADADSSGVLRFLDIRDAGSGGSPALDLVGVGSTTVLEQLYVSTSSGGGLSVRGGTAALRKARVNGSAGIGLRWDEGWRGTGQHLVIQSTSSSPLGVEGSNNLSSPDATPRSNPEIRNVTLIGAPDATTGTVGGGAVRLANGTAGVLESWLFRGLPRPESYVLDIDGSSAWDRVQADELRLTGSLILGYARLGDPDIDPPGMMGLYSPAAEDHLLRGPAAGNRIEMLDPTISGALMGAFARVPDLRPPRDGLVADTPCPPGATPLFEPASYCGAAQPPPGGLGDIPWFEPAPIVNTVATPLATAPAVVQYQAFLEYLGNPGELLPYGGLELSGDVPVGATSTAGSYFGYVASSGAIIHPGPVPSGCTAPGITILADLSPGELRLTGGVVRCN